MISCTNLSKRFGAFVAVDSLDLEIPTGTIGALLGPNGAGKSTSIQMLAGLLRPTSGDVSVAGVDVVKSPVEIKRKIGVVPEKLGLFAELTVGEHLALCGDVYGLDRDRTEDRTDELLEYLALEHGRRTFIDQCSHGMRKKTALAMAVIHDPEVLFLDEPFEGLDIATARAIQGMLLALAERGVTVLLTSHVFSLVEAVASQAVFIRRGKAVWRTDSPKDLEAAYFEHVEERNHGGLSWVTSDRS